MPPGPPRLSPPRGPAQVSVTMAIPASDSSQLCRISRTERENTQWFQAKASQRSHDNQLPHTEGNSNFLN